MGFLKRRTPTLIEWLARESGYLVAEREADYHKIRIANSHKMDYVHIRCRDTVDNVLFWRNLPVQFPVSCVPPELFKMLLMRNRKIRYGAWTIDLTGSLDVWVYVSYVAHKAALSPETFDTICRDLLEESGVVFDELREQFARLDLDRSNAALSMSLSEPMGRSLPPGGNRAITWRER